MARARKTPTIVEPPPQTDSPVGSADLVPATDLPNRAGKTRRSRRLPLNGGAEAELIAERTRRSDLENAVERGSRTAPINASLPPLVTQSRGARSRVADWIILRAAEPGITNIEVAKRLGITTHALNAIINRATREGWLQFDDPLERIEHQIIPKVVDNLNYFLDNRDKQVTIEAAKGTIFKQFADSKGMSDNQVTVLALKIEQPEPSTGMQIVTGTVVGRPREIKD